MNPPLPLEEAQARLLDQATPLDHEKIAADAADGRWLALPVEARRTQPWADLSAMDGFATGGAGPWRLVGESAAGHPFAGRLASGQATRISTGAAMPDGADAVLPVEDSAIEGDIVRDAGDPPTPRFIRRRGFDFARDDQLLPAGTRIGPAQLALAIMAGCETLVVGRQPRLAIIDTGDELAKGHGDDRPDLLPPSNGAMLAAMTRRSVAAVRRVGPVPDRLDALHSAFAGCGEADVIVTTGGASVGEHDLIAPVLRDWGASIEFWRVAIRPGKPLLVARRGSQWIVGLPGNPVSAYVTAHLFLLPLLRRLAGASAADAVPRAAPATLQGELGAVGARRQFVRGVLQSGSVRPIEERDSSALRALAGANCLIDRPPGAPPLMGPATVDVYPLDA